MPRAKKICAHPNCPSIADGSYCLEHKRQRDKARGSREARGYNHSHRKLREQWIPRVATGTEWCAKCSQPIHPEAEWHLGHTDDRAAWTGPEHAHCNLSDAGKRRHFNP